MFRLNLNPFYSPDEAPGAEGKLSVAEIEDELSKEDDEVLDIADEELDDDKKDDDKEDDDNKDDDEKSLEEELEEDLEDKVKDEEDIVIDVPRKAILAKYPDLFKDFPQLNKAMYRERAYSEILPTIEDAKVAAEKAETLDNFGKELENGNTVTILKAVKEENPEAFNSLVDNYLGQLQSVDENAYYHVLSNVIKHTIIAMAQSSDEEAQAAAAIVNKFIFKSEKFDPPRLLGKPKEKDSKEQQLQEREEKFRKEQLDTHVESINKRVENSIKATIDKNIDPRESMSPYMRKTALRDCQEILEAEIEKDSRFNSILDKMWERAAESNFKQDSLDKIRNAYLAKARNLLPGIIKKVRSEALRGQGKNVLSSDKRGHLPVGRERPSTPNSRSTSTKSDKDRARELPKGMKTLDFLLRD